MQFGNKNKKTFTKKEAIDKLKETIKEFEESNSTEFIAFRLEFSSELGMWSQYGCANN